MSENKNLNKKLTSFEESDEMSMADLMKEYDGIGDLSKGKEIEVTIIAENEDGFLVDLGMKSEGLIPKKEFNEGQIPPELKTGNKVKVKVVNLQGQPILSYKLVLEKEEWENLEKIFNEGKSVKGKIIRTVKGGFIVDIGVNAFLHISQVDSSFVSEPEKYVGKTYEFAITEFDKKDKKAALSRRKLLEKEKAIKKEATLKTLQAGQTVEGKVTKLTKFGAFIDLGGVDGLVHIAEMAWYKVKKAEDLLNEGQTVKVEVLKIDENGKISLSMKNLSPNPWDEASDKFPEGLVIKGKVTSVMPYGAFVELEPGIEGLLHASEYSWNDSEAEFKKNIKKDQEIEVKIIDVDKTNKKISLSVKKIKSNPWDDVFKHYAPGSVVKGVIQNLMPFGAFVKLPEGVEGLVHINDFSWTEKVKHPEEKVKKGQEIEVVVLEVNPKNEKISLSIKHITPDPYKKYKTGSIIKGKVIKTNDYGAFIELEPGLEAFIKNNEVSIAKGDKLKEGEEVEAKITKFDARDKKIEASIKKLEFDREKELVKKFANKDERPTLGQILTDEE